MRIAKTTNRTEGLIFSRDGKTQLHNSFIWKGFEQLMQNANIFVFVFYKNTFGFYH